MRTRGRSETRGIEDPILHAIGWAAIALGLVRLVMVPSLGTMFGRSKRRGLFGGLLRSKRTGGTATATIALGGATLLALLEGQRRAIRAEPMDVSRSITIGKSPEELSRALHDPDTLPLIMEHFADVTSLGDGHTRWIVRSARSTLEWDARMVEHRPGESIRWVSVSGSPVHVDVSMRFRPAPDAWGTEVSMRLSFDPPSRVIRSVARLLGIIPSALATKALHRFKSLVETGEIPSIRYQPAARDGGRDI
jgi:uncharacterized membrane protein